MTRLIAAIGLVLLLAGCGAGMKLEDFEGKGPGFRLEEYFLGPTRAWGWFEDRAGKIQRRFVVTMTGRVEDGVLLLDEDFVYDDGETENRVWRIEILGDGRYRVTTDGVVGTAEGRIVGPALNWTYAFDLQVGERTWQVHFDDWLIRHDETVVINKAVVSKFGFTVGRVPLFFKKPDDWTPPNG